MTDDRNHWDALASLLGAEPAPEDSQPEPIGPAAEPTKSQPKQVPSSPRAAAPRPRRPAANWDEVAGSLGITPLPPPPPPPPPRSPAPAAVRPAVAPPSMPVEVLGPPAGGFAELAEELAEEMAAVDEGPADFVPPRAESEGKSGHRRRKRRRRGRGPQEAGPDQPPRGAGPPEASDLELELPEEEEAEGPLESAEELGGVSVAGPRPRRPERRRGRRGRSRDREPGRESGAPGAVEEEERPADEGIEVGPLDLPDAMDDEGDADVASAKAGFRSIPTWQEAVGILVSANLESRARRPGNGAPSGPGGRGSREKHRGGGNRGSRPRSGKRH